MWLSGTPISLKPNCWTKWLHLFLKMCTEDGSCMNVNNTMNAKAPVSAVRHCSESAHWCFVFERQSPMSKPRIGGGGQHCGGIEDKQAEQRGLGAKIASVGLV